MIATQSLSEQAETVVVLATNLLDELTQSDKPEGLVSSKSLEALDETLRCFAFTEASYPSPIRQSLRILELASQTIKPCLDNKLVDLGQRIMGLVAIRLDALEIGPAEKNPNPELELVATEYYMLRIYHAWSEGRLDIADHLFGKVPEIKTNRQRVVVADICYEIGDNALSLGQYETALVWLNRAMSSCEVEEGHDLGQYSKDNRLLILHAFTRACLHSTKANPDNRLQKALELLKKEYGDQLPVLALSLEDLIKKGDIGQEYFLVLESSIQAMDNNEASIKLLYHYLQKTKNSSPERFVRACGQLFAKLDTLDSEIKRQWMEKTFVSIICALTSIDHGHLPLVETAACQLTENGLDRLSEDATSASLMPVWKIIDKLVARRSINIAEEWCCFALNLKQPIFQLTPNTETQFFRKWIICVLDKPEHSARRITDTVSASCKACPRTLYLLYKLALSREDNLHATAYLELLSQLKASTTYIQACISDALRLGKIEIAVRSCGGLIAASDSDLDQQQISQLVKYLLNTTCTMVTHKNDLEQVVPLLESIDRGRKGIFSATDLYWLACRSYAIAFENIGSASPQATIRLLKIAIEFTEAVERGADLELKPDSVDCYLHCTYFLLANIIKEARDEVSNAGKTTQYNEVREALKQFHPRIQSISTDKQVTWLERYRIMLFIDFEAAIFLQQWQDLEKIFETSKPIVDGKLASYFLECILQSEASSPCVSRAVKQLIRALHSSPLPYLNTPAFTFSETLPRYFRILFTLSQQGEEYILAESVLDQALLLASDNPRYPREELEWLATTAFNQAVEFFSISADEKCQRWARKAVALTDYIKVYDGGKLGSLLRGNLAKLNDS
ncbi:meiosis protein SPO22/ZIP4 like-domain-containing protein [Aspergillus germanicus]